MSIEKYLKTGNLIELEIPSKDKEKTKLHVLVDKPLNKGILSITTPMNKGRTISLAKGSVVKITFSNGNNTTPDVYSATCRIIGKNTSGNINTLSLQLTSSPKKIQRREYFRFPVIKTIDMEYQDIDYELITKNISANGLRGITNKNIPEGETCLIFFPIDGELLKIQSKVVLSSINQDGNYKYDLRFAFIDISEKTKSKITHYIFKQQSEVARKKLDKSLLGRNYSYNGDTQQFNFSNLKFADYVPIFAWAITILMFGLFTKALPEHQNGLDKFFGYIRNPNWNSKYLIATLYTTIFQIVFCGYGMIFRSVKRKEATVMIILHVLFALIVMVLCAYLYTISA